MDFCLTRIYTKFYVSQILHAMKYIEYNHINYYLQEDLLDMDDEAEKALETPKKVKIQAKSDNNPSGEINTKEIPASFIANQNLINQEKNENLSFNNEKMQNELDLNEEEKMIIDEIEKDGSVNEDLILSAAKSNNNEFKLTDQEINQIMQKKDSEAEIINYDEFNHDENIKNDSPKAKNIKKFELIELNKENEAKYRKTFVYKNNVFSKVEIQGLVVDRRVFGHVDAHNYRMKLIIDDSTGAIEVFVWRSKKENIFNKLRDEVVSEVIE